MDLSLNKDEETKSTTLKGAGKSGCVCSEATLSGDGNRQTLSMLDSKTVGKVYILSLDGFFLKSDHGQKRNRQNAHKRHHENDHAELR